MHLRVYVLTGQSNALGTTNGTESDTSPGFDPADLQVRFWWENWAGSQLFLGGCTDVQPLSVQQGGYYVGSASHWGPEFGFGRALWNAGQRDFMIVKCCRGGGGNSLWHKPEADHHMYDYVCQAVSNAVTSLSRHGHTFEVVGLLYFQGESNTALEASEAAMRFRSLLDNLRVDLPNASRMNGCIGGIAAASADRDTTRMQHDAIYGQHAPEVAFFTDLDLADEVVLDNLHFNRQAKLCIGGRFADAVLQRVACYSADRGSTAALDPVIQGWSLTLPSGVGGQFVAGLAPDSGSTNNAWQIEDSSALVRGHYYTRQFSPNLCSWASGLGWTLKARSRLVAGYGAGSAWFLQYGNGAECWVLHAQIDATGGLVLSWDRDAAALDRASVTVQTDGDGGYHEFALHNVGGSATVDVGFDGVKVGEMLPIATSAALPPGVHWGTASAAGMVKANWNLVDFTLGQFSIGPTSFRNGAFHLSFSGQAGRTYAVWRSTNWMDWTPVGSNVAGMGAPTVVIDADPPPASPAYYRVRMNP